MSTTKKPGKQNTKPDHGGGTGNTSSRPTPARGAGSSGKTSYAWNDRTRKR